MYLKSIEVQGFKSFANKIRFEFNNGITGIVGPNGSGKSNVADAVRWVLGEQRVKQLRGGSMQDVIFSGTENRKPLSYAVVSITLDNSDHQLQTEFEEVTVTRKIYRSGESEYLINGKQCRLKDVNELFYDTGIGKEGYSIIGQGQIDKILSGKPEDRRELFDEAAGIVKFKRRKSISLKKLEEERQNLVRVRDILQELEKQVGPLKKQSETAREYLKKKEVLKKYEINLFLLESDVQNRKLSELEKTLELVKEESSGAEQQYASMKEEYEAVEEQTDEVEASLEYAKNQLNETHLLRQQLENKIELLNEQIRSARQNDRHYETRVSAVMEELQQKKQQEKELLKEEEDLSGKLKEKREEGERAQEALLLVQTDLLAVANKIDENKSRIMEILNHRASTRADIQKFDTMLEQIQVSKARLQQQVIRSESDRQELQEQRKGFQEQAEVVTEEIRQLSEENAGLEEEVARLQKELGDQTEKFRIGQTAYHREKSRLESLKNITERYDGYGNSIRKVMEQKEKEAGLLGVVADIIKVEKEYETAIEMALGGSIQNIVTRDEAVAKRMIQYLKKNRLGRATFLPLTGIREHAPARTEVAKETGVIGTADTLVTADKEYTSLIRYLLSRTWVVDTIDRGISLNRKYKQSLRIVTLEGELLNPGGSLTGGAYKNSGNLLGRRREIEAFEKTVDQLKREMDALENEMEAIRRKRGGCYGRMEEISEALKKLFVSQNTAKMQVSGIDAQMEGARQTLETAQKELEKLSRDRQQIGEDQESIRLELETSTSLEASLEEEIRENTLLLEKEKEKESAMQKQVEEMGLLVEKLRQKHHFSRENLSRIREELEKFSRELEELGQGRGKHQEEVQEKETQIRDLQQTIADSLDLQKEVEEEIDRCKKQKEDLLQQNKDFLQKREDLSRHMAELDKEAFRLESQKESCENQIESRINYMWEEYELTYHNALELRDESLSELSDMKKTIQEIRNEIRRLGNVNVNAIDEYKSVSERYEFLKEQHDDLIEAEKTLEQIIESLDTAMKKQFKEQFAKIASEFDLVFKELFGGGRGTLELLEEEDLLETGIRIIAQPPGKKLQNMMQLSGGEKALTAISLLFAIQNLKPSPFCLLDEIEAALDDNNVGRFAKYLHKLTKYTQFIVITHRRGTMTAADRLYGITMQEKGVSVPVSVSLLDKELTG